MHKRIFGGISLFLCWLSFIIVFFLSSFCLFGAQITPPGLGLFQNHGDIGNVLRAGSVNTTPRTTPTVLLAAAKTCGSLPMRFNSHGSK